MRYRRFGQSDLVVSEVGFGTWTLVTDWWGRTDHPHAMITAALDAGINFIDTAPVYGTDGAGEIDPRAVPHGARRHRDHHEVRLRHQGRAQVPRPVGAPAADWRPESIRQQCEDSLRRLGTDRIDLYQLHNPRIEPILADDLWEALLDAASTRARCASSASRSVRRSAGSKKATARSTTARSCRCRPCSTCSSRSRAARSRSGRACSTVRSALISRVPHASDSLSGKVTPDTVFAQGRSPRAPQPRQHARQLREGRDALVPLGAGDRPHDRAGRDRRRSSPTPRSRACCRPCCRSTTCASTRPRPTCRSPPTSTTQVDALWARNFDHVDRYVMPLKSSV